MYEPTTSTGQTQDRGCLRIGFFGCSLLVGLPLLAIVAGIFAMGWMINQPVGEPLPVVSVAGDCPVDEVEAYVEAQGARMERMTMLLEALDSEPEILGEGSRNAHFEGSPDSFREALASVDFGAAEDEIADLAGSAVPECLQGYREVELDFYRELLAELEAFRAVPESGESARGTLSTALRFVRIVREHFDRMREAEAALKSEHGIDFEGWRGPSPDSRDGADRSDGGGTR
jgi:hypothetical protein